MAAGDSSADEERKPRVQANRAAWRVVALGALVVVIALIAALLAQDGLWSDDPTDPDGLTTLALVLAILAFFVQLFVFIFQAADSNRAVQRSDELNRRTQATLEKIEASSAATQKVLFAQFDRLLDYVVGVRADDDTARGADAEVEAEDETLEQGSEPVTASELARVVREALAEQAAPRPVFSAGRSVPSRADADIINYLQAFPTDRAEVDRAVPELRRLSPVAVALLTRMAVLEIRQRSEGRAVGLPAVDPIPRTSAGLIEAGLLRPAGRRVALTDRGRELARVLPIGRSEKGRPEWWDDAIAPLREPTAQ